MADFGFIDWQLKLSATEQGRRAIDHIRRLEQDRNSLQRLTSDLQKNLASVLVLTEDLSDVERVALMAFALEFQPDDFFNKEALKKRAATWSRHARYNERTMSLEDVFYRAMSEVLRQPTIYLNHEVRDIHVTKYLRNKLGSHEYEKETSTEGGTSEPDSERS